MGAASAGSSRQRQLNNCGLCSLRLDAAARRGLRDELCFQTNSSILAVIIGSASAAKPRRSHLFLCCEETDDNGVFSCARVRVSIINHLMKQSSECVSGNDRRLGFLCGTSSLEPSWPGRVRLSRPCPGCSSSRPSLRVETEAPTLDILV